MTTKLCPRCKETKDTAEFWRNASAFDGLQTYCKTCIKAAMKSSEAKNKAARSDAPASAPMPEPAPSTPPANWRKLKPNEMPSQAKEVKGTVSDKVREAQRLTELALSTRNWALKIEATGTREKHGYFTVREWCERFNLSQRIWKQVKNHMIKMAIPIVWDDGVGHFIGEDGEQAKTIAALSGRMAAYGETLYYMLEAAQASGEWEKILPQLQDSMKGNRHELHLENILQLMQGAGLKVNTNLERLLLAAPSAN